MLEKSGITKYIQEVPFLNPSHSLSRAELFFLLDGLLEVDDLDGPFAGGLVPHDLVERSVVPGVDEPHEGDVARLLAPLLLLRLGRRPELLLQAVPNSPEL